MLNQFRMLQRGMMNDVYCTFIDCLTCVYLYSLRDLTNDCVEGIAVLIDCLTCVYHLGINEWMSGGVEL